MENELLKNDTEINNIFDNIKELVINSRNKVYSVVNTEMLNLYWNIGKAIMEIQQGDERASYGDAVLEKLSQKLTKNEKILYLFSNCDNSVVAIKLVPLPRTN